ncbi:Aste57867_10021 [Aphanomyces stellatus]|uniref:Aste57867_10021 protein n=1 Tax=Aphanomyces stellatus TaxID=120398 RepID=A0A485KQ86_9STRA|nr:hypothetical protein As57867_009982 [Aphanomyces stellatus]VFT86899.1 Aste57867_10021 [Aphanomyces stellatus]
MELDLDMHMELEHEELHIMDLMHKNLFPAMIATSPTAHSPKSGKRRALSLNKVTIEDFYEYFDKPIVAVAREFGVCTTLFKKICRKSGIRRWPYRKISSLSKTIEAIQDTLTQDLTSVERGKMVSQLDELHKKRDYVRKNPNSKVALVKPADALSIASRFVSKRASSSPAKPQSSGDSESDQFSATQSSPHGYHRTNFELCDTLEDDFHFPTSMYVGYPHMAPCDVPLEDYNCVVEI